MLDKFSYMLCIIDILYIFGMVDIFDMLHVIDIFNRYKIINTFNIFHISGNERSLRKYEEICNLVQNE